MPPVKNRLKQLKEARRTRSDIREAIRLSLAEEAMFDEHAQDWEEVLMSDSEAGGTDGQGGEDEGEDVWSQIAADTVALWKDHVERTREVDQEQPWLKKSAYDRTSERSLFRQQKEMKEHSV